MPPKKKKAGDRGVICIHNPQKKGLMKPEAGVHGLVLPNGSFCAAVGGIGSSKTTTILNTIARCAKWKPYSNIWLMSPNVEAAQKGEYGLIRTKRFPNDVIPPLKYFNEQPARACVILDDTTLEMSTKKHKEDGLSQRDRLNRLVGHMRSHHEGGIDVFLCQQQMIAIPTSIRRLVSHWCLFPNRIDRGSLHTIARSVMLSKRTLEALFDMCMDMGPYTFLLIEQERLPHRARVRINGWQEVPGIN